MAGIETKWNCEIMPYNRAILMQHFPESKQYDDIRTLSKPSPVHIISGGFPCQDISSAGSGKGIRGERSGLWKEYARIIREVRPLYVVAENSPNLVVRGFEQVLCDLSEMGYDAEWQCLPATAFGASHQRERIYVVAYSLPSGFQTLSKLFKKPSEIFGKTSDDFSGFDAAKGIYGLGNCEQVRRGDEVPYKSHRIKALGNAVIPTIAHYLFECIKHHHSITA